MSLGKESTKYQQIITISFYGSSQAISFILIAQVIYLNFHYLIGASLSVVACLSLFFQVVIGIAQALYYDGHKKSPTVESLVKVQFYVNCCFTLVFIGFMIWTIVYMYEHSVAPP